MRRETSDARSQDERRETSDARSQDERDIRRVSRLGSRVRFLASRVKRLRSIPRFSCDDFGIAALSILPAAVCADPC